MFNIEIMISKQFSLFSTLENMVLFNITSTSSLLFDGWELGKKFAGHIYKTQPLLLTNESIQPIFKEEGVGIC